MTLATAAVLKTRVQTSPGRGRGVFAAVPIAAGETIERAHVLELPGPEWDLVEQTSLFDFCFAWGQGLQDSAVVLGHGSLYNHSYAPSARFVRHVDERVMEFVARRDIAPGEEITINYNEDQESQAPVWFDVR